MSSTSTAALEYNTNGELTIKNRQNESTGNSLKFKTINSELTPENINKLIDIKQNNNSRLSIDEIGTGAIKIERNEADPEDLKYSAIKMESNTYSKTSSDVNHNLTVNPYGVSLGTSVYSEDDKGDIHSTSSRYIDINTINKNEGNINLQNNKYQLDGNNEFKLNNQKEFIKDSYTYMKLGLSDLELGVVKEKDSNNTSYKSYMNFHIDNGITINSEQHDFTIKNKDYTIRAPTDVPTSTLRFECVPDTSKPDTTKTLMEMTKSSVNINSLSIGSGGPTISSVASSSLSPSAGDDQILPTIGYVKKLIPNFNITDANNFYLQPSDGNKKIFYLAYKYGLESDNKVYGMKITFDETNAPTITGFKGTVTNGKISES